jgi:hypothetical protein
MIYLTLILHILVPNMCSINAEKYTHIVYIWHTYQVIIHIYIITYILYNLIYLICVIYITT